MKVDFFYVPSSQYSHKFIEALREVYLKLKDRMIFEPHIVTFTSKSNEYITNNCVSQGKYCAFDPDNEGPITGKDVIMEALRQKCIYKAGITQYFYYMDMFFTQCITKFTEECSNHLIWKSGIDSSDITSCVNNSFNKVNVNFKDNENEILAEEREKVRKLGTTHFPNIYINNLLYNGTLATFDLLLSMCSSLNDESQECRNLSFNSNSKAEIFFIIMIHVIIYIIGVLILATVCKKLAKKRYEKDLNTVVNRYVSEYSSIREDSFA